MVHTTPKSRAPQCKPQPRGDKIRVRQTQLGLRDPLMRRNHANLRVTPWKNGGRGAKVFAYAIELGYLEMGDKSAARWSNLSPSKIAARAIIDIGNLTSS